MGITIHLQGNLKDRNIINSLVEELQDISKSMDWGWQVLDEDWSKPSTAKLSHTNRGAEIIGELSLKGISISIHPRCEALSLYFDSEGTLTTPVSTTLYNEGKIERENIYSTVKTQFAPPEVHITIIKLLKYLKKRYIPNLKVFDEGEYWESEDKEKLVDKINFLNEKMNQLEGVLSEVEIENIRECSPEQLADILEERIKKEFNQK